MSALGDLRDRCEMSSNISRGSVMVALAMVMQVLGGLAWVADMYWLTAGLMVSGLTIMWVGYRVAERQR